MTDQPINSLLIVGGGVAGLSLAIRAARAGRRVEIAEADPQWRAAGAGLTLNGMTLKAFLELGVLERIREHAHLHGGRRTIGADHRILSDEPAFVPEDGDVRAGGGILRPVLHGIMRDAALEAGAVPRLGVALEGLEQDADGVDVALSDGSRGRYDLVAAADGLRSRVRSLCFPDAPQPHYTGEGCWRAVFRRPPEVAAPWTQFGTEYKAGLRPVSRDEMYLHLVEPAPDNPWRAEEEWPSMLAERMRSFGGVIGDLAGEIGSSSLVNYRPLETILVPLPWHRGRVVMLGDAVHATTPHAAYGAGLAVEDALVLGTLLDRPGTLEERLQRYGELRFPRCRDIVEAAIAVGEIEMAHGSSDEWMAGFARLRAAILEPLPAV